MFTKGGNKMYEINDGTLAILFKEQGKSEILEEDCQYIVDQKPYKIMDYSCQYFGSSYEGREQGSQRMLGSSRYKVPVIVEETKNLIFFPTVSPSSNDCSWVALNKIKNYEKQDQNTKIVFQNDQEIILPISYRTIENQILRATRLESILHKRKK